MTTKKTLQAFLKYKLQNDGNWAIRAVWVLLSRQTAHEKALSQTVEHNKVGFTAFDAEILTSLADQAIAGKRLSSRQIALLNRMMPKYWSQLIVEAKTHGKLEKLEEMAEKWSKEMIHTENPAENRTGHLVDGTVPPVVGRPVI